MKAHEYYECHVTYLDAPWLQLEPPKFWSHSKIDGDPTLGAGVKSYLTRQFSIRMTKDEVIDEVEGIADWLRNQGKMVLRAKVELVVYDHRS